MTENPNTISAPQAKGRADTAAIYDSLDRRVPIVCVCGLCMGNEILTPDGYVWPLYNLKVVGGSGLKVVALLERVGDNSWGVTRYVEVDEIPD